MCRQKMGWAPPTGKASIPWVSVAGLLGYDVSVFSIWRYGTQIEVSVAGLLGYDVSDIHTPEFDVEYNVSVAGLLGYDVSGFKK